MACRCHARLPKDERAVLHGALLVASFSSQGMRAGQGQMSCVGQAWRVEPVFALRQVCLTVDSPCYRLPLCCWGYLLQLMAPGEVN